MKTKLALALASLALLPACTALAQDSDHAWSKTWTVTGKPTLIFETSDASVDFHPCGDCHQIRHPRRGRRPQDSTTIASKKAKPATRFTSSSKSCRTWACTSSGTLDRTHVTVETPAQLTLQARTSDGNVTLTGLQGDLSLTTGDGDVALDHVSGDLRIKSGDGHVRITDADGALDAHTSDGSLTVDGLFHALALHTSDGRLDLSLREGTKLTVASTIQSSDGPVTIHVPQNFAADLNVHTSDGRVDCALPIAVDHYQSSGGHELHGKINGGGTPLTIHTSDGNVRIEQL